MLSALWIASSGIWLWSNKPFFASYEEAKASNERCKDFSKYANITVAQCDAEFRENLAGQALWQLQPLASILAAPPLALLALGLAARWVIAGFRQGRAA